MRPVYFNLNSPDSEPRARFNNKRFGYMQPHWSRHNRIGIGNASMSRLFPANGEHFLESQGAVPFRGK